MTPYKLIKALVAVTAVTTFSLASAADTSDPFVGTWVLDVARSTFDPGPPLKSDTTKITDAGNGALHQVVDIVDGDGTATHMEFTFALDGKEVPVTGGSGSDTVSASRPHPRTVKYVFRTAGKWSATGTFAVSKNGKTTTGSIHGIEAGTAWKYHYVLNRQ
jgi:hypothetical protein